MKLLNQDICEISCYKEPKCVSYNYGPKQSEKPWCDLNNRTHLQVSPDDFVTKDGYTYRDVLVRERTFYQSINQSINRSVELWLGNYSSHLKLKEMTYNSVKDPGLSIAIFNNYFKNYRQ